MLYRRGNHRTLRSWVTIAICNFPAWLSVGFAFSLPPVVRAQGQLDSSLSNHIVVPGSTVRSQIFQSETHVYHVYVPAAWQTSTWTK